MQKNSKKTNKRIGILTYHCAYNYGAMLQAYALQKTIAKICDCEIIDYEPDFQTKPFIPRIESYVVQKNEKNPIKLLKQWVLALYGYYVVDNCHRKKRNFESFKKRFNLSEKMTSISELKQVLSNYDKIIVGSDQIWRTAGGGAYHFEYFLDFEKPRFLKYSYAASAGSCFPKEDIDTLKPLLCDFKRVSVREKALANQLDQFGIECRVDVDPTLLLDREDYEQIEKALKIHKNYIFVYLCHDDRAVKTLDYLSKALNCEIIFGPSVEFKSPISFEYKQWDYLGPREFLYCMHHASFIVSSSFHCTVFSILYNRPFLVFDRVGTFERIRNLLEFTGLSNHIFDSIEKIDYSTNYDIAVDLIRQKAKESLNYIEEIIDT